MTTPTRIYHNPRCSKSRGALQILEQQNLQPEVIRYLDTPPDPATLKDLLKQLGISARQLLRRGEAEYKDLGLDNPDLSEEQLIDAMSRHPKLIERPIIVKDGKAIIARPPERVHEILSQPTQAD